MKLYDSDTENFIEFEFLKATNSSEIECQIQVFKKGNIVISRKGIILRSKILSLAKWLDSLWDECAPVLIEELGLRFEFSHREHIGEGFFYIIVDNIKYLLIYEQLGQSNVAHAKELLASMERVH